MRGEAAGGSVEVDIELRAADWARALPAYQALGRDAASAALAMAVAPEGNREAGRELCLVFADDALVRRLNRQFRGQDKPTNVLSFAAGDDGPPEARISLGDVVLALETCRGEAQEQGKPLAAHVSHLVVHGVLHLLGYDHGEEDEAQVMEDLERRVLERLGLPDPYREPIAETGA